MRRIAAMLVLVCGTALAGCADLEALLTDTQQDIAVVQGEIDKAAQNPETAELAAKWQKTVDEAKATLDAAKNVYESAKEDGAAAVETGGTIATSLGYPEVGLILTTLGALWRARKNRKDAVELAASVEKAIDKEAVGRQSASVKRIVDESQGTKAALPF